MASQAKTHDEYIKEVDAYFSRLRICNSLACQARLTIQSPNACLYVGTPQERLEKYRELQAFEKLKTVKIVVQGNQAICGNNYGLPDNMTHLI